MQVCYYYDKNQNVFLSIIEKIIRILRISNSNMSRLILITPGVLIE